MSVAIAGNGWVGRSMHELFPDAYVHDEPEIRAKQPLHMQEMTIQAGRHAVNQADVAFVCVPTDGKEDGALDTSIVEEVVGWCESDLIVVRSTVNPGTIDRIKGNKHIVMQPEFLGETPNHPMSNPRERQWMVIGGEPEDRRKLIDLYATVYNSNVDIRQVTALEAEVAKLSENRAIGFKVMQMHELYEACEAAGLDYYTIRDTVYGADPRFDLWFTFIPEQLGFESSKCLSKDVPAWNTWAESVGFDPTITKVLVDESKK
jgi:UDP-glucose 6-dehydrogenase